MRGLNEKKDKRIERKEREVAKGVHQSAIGICCMQKLVRS